MSLDAIVEAVGKRFESGEYFLPHLMTAGEMFKQISETIKPRKSLWRPSGSFNPRLWP